MPSLSELNVFLKPQSVTVIGATERPGSWGSFIMNGLLSRTYPGKIFPVNHRADHVYGIRAYKEVGSLPESPDLAILTIPGTAVKEAIEACGRKGVKGISIITAGYGEAVDDGKKREGELVRLARSYGMRLLGPNVSGTFNLYAEFNGSASPEMHLVKSRIAAVCQGGYAIYDLLAHGFFKGMGVGKFVHTGNESDLTTTDFLEHLGHDPEVEAVLMYVEAVKDGKRFLKVARDISQKKPIVMYKAGKFKASSRAAKSHTGALSGIHGVYQGALDQANVLISPTMELLLPLGHALTERPPMGGNRVAILTMGGSWGVALTDTLEMEGLRVPELSETLQSKLRKLGMPVRASVKNPVDIGASGLFFDKKLLFALGRSILTSGEADAMILHGMGRPGMLDENAPERLRLFLETNKEIIRGYAGMEKTFGLPVLIGTIFASRESQVVYDLNEEGIRIYDRLDEIAQILSLMYRYRVRRESISCPH
ncbi:MAG: CoA-binding protein [Deltaproteobacteria bacterium]|nr:CoA-binding protein [Deltaproteobacteria bacterium]